MKNRWKAVAGLAGAGVLVVGGKEALEYRNEFAERNLTKQIAALVIEDGFSAAEGIDVLEIDGALGHRSGRGKIEELSLGRCAISNVTFRFDTNGLLVTDARNYGVTLGATYIQFESPDQAAEMGVPASCRAIEMLLAEGNRVTTR